MTRNRTVGRITPPPQDPVDTFYVAKNDEGCLSVVQNKAGILDHRRALYKWEEGGRGVGQRWDMRRTRSDVAGLEGGGGARAQECGKGKDMGPPLESPERNAALLDTLTVPSETPAGLLTSRAVGNDPACSSPCVVASYRSVRKLHRAALIAPAVHSRVPWCL